MPARTTLSLIEDHAPQRELWVRRIGQSRDFVCHSAHATAESALARLLDSPPQLVLVDWKLPGMDGLSFTREFKSAHPDRLVVLITAHDEVELPDLALLAGVDGCLYKQDHPRDPLPALRLILTGNCVISARFRHRLGLQLRAHVEQPDLRQWLDARLSLRENEVIECLCCGLTAKEIAARFAISLHTVDTHCREIRSKLEARNTAHAVHLWQGSVRPSG